MNYAEQWISSPTFPDLPPPAPEGTLTLHVPFGVDIAPLLSALGAVFPASDSLSLILTGQQAVLRKRKANVQTEIKARLDSELGGILESMDPEVMVPEALTFKPKPDIGVLTIDWKHTR